MKSSATGEVKEEGRRPLILAVGGSHRPGASTDKALKVASAAAEQAGAEIELVPGSDLQFPIYGSADPDCIPSLQQFLKLYQQCDGLLLASPGYHGSISGLLKNALDYTDVLRGKGKAYLDGKAVGCIVCAYGWQATGTTLVTMRNIVHALRGWPTPLAVAINSSLPFLDDDGNCVDKSIQSQLEILAEQVVAFARMQIALRPTGETLVSCGSAGK